VSRPETSRTGWPATVAAVAKHPRLWPTAIGQARRLARRRWWATPPFLPLPDRAWLRFRLETQYGDPSHPPVADDVVTWLQWAADNAGPRRRAQL
jgi:hypothetical protein